MATTARGDDRRMWKRALWTVPLLVVLGSLSGLLSNSGYSNAWFAALDKPWFMPPGWAFGVVWTTLYTILGLALATALDQPRSKARSAALTLFGVQMALNFAWSPIFFGGAMIEVGLVTIAVMGLFATLTALRFYAIRPLAGGLMLPYLAWLCLAAALNFEIGRLNPGADALPLGLFGG